MENGKERAFAMLEPNGSFTQYGLTKREYFAAMAMQGLLSAAHISPRHGNPDVNAKSISIIAIECADELLKELETNG